jgi:hypothetical protein
MTQLKINDRLGWRNRLNMINLIIKKLMPLTRLEIKKGNSNKIIQSENNTVIQVAGGIPEGYEETDIVLCENGTPVNGKILFKED